MFYTFSSVLFIDNILCYEDALEKLVDSFFDVLLIYQRNYFKGKNK